MQTSLDHIPHVQAADVAFHETVLALSHKRIAESIARSLFERARKSRPVAPSTCPVAFHEQTPSEHDQILAAIAAGVG